MTAVSWCCELDLSVVSNNDTDSSNNTNTSTLANDDNNRRGLALERNV